MPRPPLALAAGLASAALALSFVPRLAADDAKKPDPKTTAPAPTPAPAADAEEGFVALFNGKDLTGWEGDEKLWVVEDGQIAGKSPGIKHNDFLATKERFGDFVLKLRFKLVETSKGANSGVQFRTERVKGSHEVSGYQADLGEGYFGCLYDESRRNKVLAHAPKELEKVLKRGDWNEYVITAVGDRITLEINGLKTVDYTEADPKIARDGIIALQVHSGGPMEARFKDIRIKKLGKRE
jgi:hypothetical protein